MWELVGRGALMKGLAAHFGVNTYYRSATDKVFDQNLESALKDAGGFASLSAARNFEVICGRAREEHEVKIETIRLAIEKARAELESGDFFILTFDGYGFRYKGEAVWQLYRDAISVGVVIRWLQALSAGVRVLVVSSCCYSGFPEVQPGAARVRGMNAPSLPDDAEWQVFTFDPWGDQVAYRYLLQVEQLMKLYGDLPQNNPPIVYVAACGANQRVPDGDSNRHSPFVDRFLSNAAAQLTLTDFEGQLRAASPADAMPELSRFAQGVFDPGFENVGVFRIG
jgi:hypothetical protein